jgi:hypothetical protein
VPRRLPDVRTAFLAVFGWAGALTGAGHGATLPLLTVGALVLAASGLWRWRGRGAGLAVIAGLVVFGAVATASGVRYERVAHNPLTELARTRTAAVLTGVVADDPRQVQSKFGVEVRARLDVREVEANGRALRLR